MTYKRYDTHKAHAKDGTSVTCLEVEFEGTADEVMPEKCEGMPLWNYSTFISVLEGEDKNVWSMFKWLMDNDEPTTGHWSLFATWEA